MIDLTLEEVYLLRIALTHLAVTGKGKCAVVGDSARVFHDVMGKLINWRKESVKDEGEGGFSKMISKGDLRTMLDIIGKYKKQLKWSDDEYDVVSRVAEKIISELGIGGDGREMIVSKMLLKKRFAKKLSALLCEKTQELLDDFDNDTTFEPTIGEEEHKELLDWADKFIDKIANHAVMVCLEVADGKVTDLYL